MDSKIKTEYLLEEKNIISSDFEVIAASNFDNSGFRDIFSQLKNKNSTSLENLTSESQPGHVGHDLLRRRVFVKKHSVVSC
jgi:hypothetical protein